MTGSVRLTLMTTVKGEPSGFDSAITTVPPRMWRVTDGERVFLTRDAGRELRTVSENLAARLGEQLHHASWTITADPGEVEELGMMHDCVTCRAGVDQALAFMREHPDREMAVGQLWWAQS